MKLFNIFKRNFHYMPTWLTCPWITYFSCEPLFWLTRRRAGVQEIDLLQLKRVFVVRLDEIGDVVMTTPFLRELRRNLPHAWITLVVKPAVYNLVELCPYVNEVLTYDWSGPRFLRLWLRHWRALQLAWKQFWRRRYDLAILPRWDTDHYHGTYLLYLSGAPWRVGYSENVTAPKKRDNRGFDFLLTHVLENNILKHEVEHNLDMIRFIGGKVEDERLELWVGLGDESFADEVLKKHNVQPDELLVGFGPSGGNSPLKQWPVSNFATVGTWLQTEFGARVVIVGGSGEEPMGEEISYAVGPSAINMVGRTTLRQMATLLKRCHLYAGNDAGPMHVAAAMRIPVVALFGSSCHHRFGPWHKPSILLWSGLPCSPCFQEHHPDRCQRCIFDRLHCMLNITVDQVKEAVTHLICTKGNMRALGDGVVKKDRTAKV